MMRAGTLRKRVTIQKLETAQNSYGEPEEAWTDFAHVWAEVVPLQGKEFFAAQQVNASLTTKVRLRYLAGIIPSMRISIGNRLLNIESIINIDERNKELELVCSEEI